MTTFEHYQLQPYVQAALHQQHFTTPTPVQAAVLPVLLKRQDAIVQSPTGSGKTLAFLLPMLQKLDLSNHALPQVVITVPSRELAGQIEQVLVSLIQDAPEPILVQLLVGGTDKERQFQKIEHQQPQIVIGTPGRVWDAIRSHVLRVDQVHYFVVDEADMTLDMGFLKDVDHIASQMPQELQISVFSATIPDKLQPFLRKYLTNPQKLMLNSQAKVLPQIDNYLVDVKGSDRNALLLKVLENIQPYLALIFVNTKHKANEVHAFLQQAGYKVALVHGGLESRERRRVMKRVQNLEFQYVVATDLASRGIDIPGVSHVINYEIPRDHEFFIHRIGRTGRNGLSGMAITLYQPDQAKDVAALEREGIPFVDVELHHHEFVETDKRQRRSQRQAKAADFSPSLNGMVKKTARKKKPGYRKKIKAAIADEQQRQRRAKGKAKAQQQHHSAR